MKFWFDIGTPKEVMLYRPIITELEKRNHNVILTTRKYRETNDLIEYFGLDAEIVGRHGTTRNEKLLESINRMAQLYQKFKSGKIDGAISLGGVELSKIAFGLGIPIFHFMDIIEAEIVCKLTLPLSNGVFIPFHITKKQLGKYYSGENIYRYDCLDPVAWMPRKPKPVDRIGIKIKHPLIVTRIAETQASYHEKYEDFTKDVIITLKKSFPNIMFYNIPRYDHHKMIDLQSLLYCADVFIGGGGTITEEAAYCGTWTISCRSFLTTYDKWLIDNKCMFHTKTPEESVDMAIEFLSKNEKNSNCEIIRKQNFPVKNICDKIEEWSYSTTK